MKHSEKYIPLQLIVKIGARLSAVDTFGKQVYSARYLAEHHLSARAQRHFRLHEAVTVMQLYAAVRIQLINTPSPWDRILLVCRILDELEQCFCDCYDGVTLHPFSGGMEQSLRLKMLSVAGYDFEGVVSDGVRGTGT